jgi:hypothetical protein
MNVQFMEPLGLAWGRMKAALFKPFDIHKWFVIGFSAFLAGLMEASNGGSGGRFGKDGNFGEFIHFPRTAWIWLTDHPGWAIAILFAILVAMAVIIALTWVSSRGVFMFLDNVARDRIEIAKPWREYQKEGNSLFVWRLLLGIAGFATFGLLLAFFFARGAALYDTGIGPILPIGFVIGLVLIALALALIWGYISLFLKDFVAALMYKNRVTCGEAWKRFFAVFKKYPFHFVGYGILIFLLMIAFVIAVIFAGIFTCCIGWLILIIPYISTVATLPVWYTYRAFSLEFLAQFGPEYDVFGRSAAAEPPVTPAPAV